MLDSYDINAMHRAIKIGAFALLPWCLVNNWLFTNKITFGIENQVTIKRSRVPL